MKCPCGCGLKVVPADRTIYLWGYLPAHELIAAACEATVTVGTVEVAASVHHTVQAIAAACETREQRRLVAKLFEELADGLGGGALSGGGS